jgi:aminoglycoside 6-adenylyltransferase
MIENSYPSIQEKITRWAESEPEIRAAIVVGSLARKDHPGDHWYDLDMMIYTIAPHKCIQDPALLSQFGEVWAATIDHTPRGDPEWFVFYAGGLKVDILVLDIANLQGDRLSQWVQNTNYAQVFSRGIQVLIDKTPSQGRLPELHPILSAQIPNQNELTTLVNRFYLSAIHAARLIYRGDLWRARQALDDEMKQHLLHLLEWHALSVHGPDYDVWYDGRFLAEWADPQALRRLPGAFAAFTRESQIEAFYNTLRLFEDLGQDTARNLQLEYPENSARQIRSWLERNLSLTK